MIKMRGWEKEGEWESRKRKTCGWGYVVVPRGHHGLSGSTHSKPVVTPVPPHGPALRLGGTWASSPVMVRSRIPVVLGHLVGGSSQRHCMHQGGKGIGERGKVRGEYQHRGFRLVGMRLVGSQVMGDLGREEHEGQGDTLPLKEVS